MAHQIDIRPSAARLENMSPEDFETASIHSTAPSYISEVPSYHSTVPETIPPYTPRCPATNTSTSANSSSALGDQEGSPEGSRSNHMRAHASSVPQMAADTAPRGLPPVPTGPLRRSTEPNLMEFRIPTWPTISANPTARHYHSVANRRVSQASTPPAVAEGFKRLMLLDRIEEEERAKVRPLEDPYLVGEVAARDARARRLARESGDEILIREDSRWDWLLAQMKDWEERERGWNQFRRRWK